MSLIDNLKEDVSKDAGKAKEALGKVEEKAATPEGRKWVKYVAYGVVALIILGLGSCMLKSCGMNAQEHKAYIQQQNADAIAQQPVQQAPQQIVQQSGLSTGEAMALGALGGYVIGKTMMPNGQIYNGTPEQRTYVTHYYVQHPSSVPAGTKPVVAPVTPAATPAPVAKVLTPTEQKSLDQKAVKASADKAAEAEQVKMKAEQAQKDQQAKLKADLQAKQAARASAPAPKPSGFNTMSKSVSSPSRSTSSSSSGSRRR